VTQQMWLKDFLPKNVENIRIMTYGYDSSLMGGQGNARLADYRRNFIQQLENSRSSAKVSSPHLGRNFLCTLTLEMFHVPGSAHHLPGT
jgi:hypothetical protein